MLCSELKLTSRETARQSRIARGTRARISRSYMSFHPCFCSQRIRPVYASRMFIQLIPKPNPTRLAPGVAATPIPPAGSALACDAGGGSTYSSLSSASKALADFDPLAPSELALLPPPSYLSLFASMPPPPDRRATGTGMRDRRGRALRGSRKAKKHFELFTSKKGGVGEIGRQGGRRKGKREEP